MITRKTKSLLALWSAIFLAGSTAVQASPYEFKVIASGLNRPTGITIQGSDTIYFTEVPSPGVGGGLNGVKKLMLGSSVITTLHQGEPEPTNLALDKHGNLYWTCKSAGVILEQSANGVVTAPLLTGLSQPSGIAVDREGNVFFTEIPTPGVGGGLNRVSMFDGTTITVLHMGEPEPTDITVSKEGELYWTCKSAGVILEQDEDGNTSVLLAGLNRPVGIALDHKGRNLYWTEVPTPGVGGPGSGNKVWELDLESMTKSLVHGGDPQPTDITVARNGNLYWTCTSAGVIVEARRLHGRDD